MRSASPLRRPLFHLRLAFGVLCLMGALVAIPTRADDGPEAPAGKPQTPPESSAGAAAETEEADAAAETGADGTKAAGETPPAGPPRATRARARKACRGGWIADDGSADAGYGFVPSAREGIYVQQIRSEDLPSRRLDEVCVCLYKGLLRRRADFDIVFYEDQNGRPAAEPYASLPARARIEARKFREAEHFFQVDASEVEIPEGSSFVGVRWDPKEQFHLFICGDKTETTEARKGFFTEDRAKSWTDLATTRDPMFKEHRALMVRVRGQEPPEEGAADGSPPPAVAPGTPDEGSEPSTLPAGGGI